MSLGLWPARRRSPLNQGLGLWHTQSYGERILASATILNDYSPTFTRASTAYDPYNRVTAASGSRRRRPLPISRTLTVYADLIEPSRTNLFLRSQDMNNASWTKTDIAVTSGTAAAPDGSMTLDLLTQGSAGTGNHQQTVTVTAGAFVVQSRYLKYSNNQWVRLTVFNGGNGVACWFDLLNGVKGTASNIGTGTGVTASIVEEPKGSGVYRCSVGGIADGASTAISCNAFAATADNTTTRATGGAFYSGWCQAEQMPASATTGYASSYIATTSATVTRAVDSLNITYTPGQAGTLLALVVPYGWSGDQDGITQWRLWDANGVNHVWFRGSASTIGYRLDDSGRTGNLGSFTSGITNGVLSHFGAAWDSSGASAYLNGVLKVGPVAPTLLPWLVAGSGGLYRIGSQNWGGWVALLAWPRSLSAAEIAAIYRSYPTL